MIKGRKPYDPITSMPSGVKQRWQKHQDTLSPDLNSYDVISNKKLCNVNIIEFENGETKRVVNAFLPGNDSKSGVGVKKYGTVLDYPSNSSYL
jgi:hypothetical protein